MSYKRQNNIAFVGLGSMGFGMATHLLKVGYQVVGFDVHEPTLVRFEEAGGKISRSPREAAQEAEFIVCMVTNAEQADFALFDSDNGAVQGRNTTSQLASLTVKLALPQHATIVLCSTVPAAYFMQIELNLKSRHRQDIFIIDSPVSGGTVRAANGTLTVFCSASPSALLRGEKILSDMSRKLFVVPGGVGAASNVKMVNQLLAGVNIVAAAEAMSLAVRMGLNTQQLYDHIANSIASSWMFENRVPHMLHDDWAPLSALDIFVKDMGIVSSTARSEGFQAPLSSIAEQLYILASSRGYGKEDDSGIVRLFIPYLSPTVQHHARTAALDVDPVPTAPNLPKKVGLLGLSPTGLNMAAFLTKAGFHVCGYDNNSAAISEFTNLGANATVALDPSEAVSDAQVLILMGEDTSQHDSQLLGPGKWAEKLPIGSVVILSSTVSPSYARSLNTHLQDLNRDIDLLDVSIIESAAKPAHQQLTILYSGNSSAVLKATPVLSVMNESPRNICFIDGGIGSASSINLISRLLAGVHLAAAAESMAFGVKLGLNAHILYEIIKDAAGGSWMFENCVPAMIGTPLIPDWIPFNFAKDLSIVLEESTKLGCPTMLSAAAYQLYTMVRVSTTHLESTRHVSCFWELLIGVYFSKSSTRDRTKEYSFEPRHYPRLSLKETLSMMPVPYEKNMPRLISEQIASPESPILVILDDDPTGTQTCHDVAVLTVWDYETLYHEISITEKGFFILTNSRALSPKEVKALITAICKNIQQAAQTAGKMFEIVLRGDSTLRGYFPEEPEAVEEALGKADAWILAPFFYQGGRYTIEDVHYVAEGDLLVPVGQTQFAQDASFGYKSSNLSDYILEKAGSRFKRDEIFSIGISDIRRGPEHVTDKILKVPRGGIIIVNAASESDMVIFAAGVLVAQQKGRNYLYRTAAAFVSSRMGISSIPPISPSTLGMDLCSSGGLIIVGSYVPKTTAQLQSLRERRGSELHIIELPVAAIIANTCEANSILEAAVSDTCQKLKNGRDVLIMTSRELITGDNADSSLRIGSLVSAAIIKLVQNIDVTPRYIIAKGGITSSDIATKCLNMRRAVVVGQASPGVPLWRCEEETSRHRLVPYVVFPGNVGEEDALAELVERWASP